MVRKLQPLPIVLLVTFIAAWQPDAAAQRTTAASTRSRAQIGLASYYGPGFHGERTASGEVFDQNELVAAHPHLAFGTVVRVTNLENGRSVLVRVIDRGPYGRNRRKGVFIDLSKAAARRLRFIRDGIVPVRVEILKRPGDFRRADTRGGDL
jgi:rare lipoprotein A